MHILFPLSPPLSPHPVPPPHLGIWILSLSGATMEWTRVGSQRPPVGKYSGHAASLVLLAYPTAFDVFKVTREEFQARGLLLKGRRMN